MDKKHLVSLFDALCARPLTRGQEPSAELESFCQQARDALPPAAREGRAGAVELANDPDRATAILAAMQSGTATEIERAAFERAAEHSPAFALDAQSALDFVEALEKAPEQAPAHLVAALRSDARPPAAARSGFSDWWPGRARWRMAAACTVLLVGGGLAWSLYWRPTEPAGLESARTLPASKSADVPSVADRRQQAEPGPARDEGCRAAAASESSVSESAASESEQPSDRPAATISKAPADCDSDHQLAGKTPEEAEAIAAMRRAEAARQAEAAREAASMGSKFGPADSGAGQVGASSLSASTPPASIGTTQGSIAEPSGKQGFGAVFPAAPPAASTIMRPSAVDGLR